MNSAHRRMWGAASIARDLGQPNGAPRHSTLVHVHLFKPVGIFEGLRSAVAQCACGETRTTFMGGPDE